MEAGTSPNAHRKGCLREMLPRLHERDVHALTLSSSVSQPDMHCFLLVRAERNSPLQQADSHQRNAYASQYPDFYFSPIIMTQNYGAKDVFDSFPPLLSQDPSFTENAPHPPQIIWDIWHHSQFLSL